MGVDVLSPAERAEVERIVGGRITSAELVWDRPQVVRVETGDGRFIAKRPVEAADEAVADVTRAVHRRERAALELLASMPGSPAPRLIGAGDAVDIVVMEHLAPSPSVADLLLGDDREAAEAGVVGLAEVLARVHAWTAEHEGEHTAIRERLGLAERAPRWSDVTADGIEHLAATAASLGVEVPEAYEPECLAVAEELRGAGWWRGLVHGDPCPDNTSVGEDGTVRVFDFEHASYGSVLLDASYVVAPFPTCWCFGRIPSDLAARAVAAYRATLAEARPEAADDAAWRAALGTALSSWVIARGHVVANALVDDNEWGTTTMRPRLLQWMDAYLAVDPPQLPALTRVVRGVREALALRWPDASLPDYPSLPTPGRHDAVTAPPWFTGWRA